MVKAKAKDIKKQVQSEDKAVYGEEAMGGSSPSPDSDDDIGEMYKEIIGHEPKKGESIADEVEEAERFRRGQPVHDRKKRKKLL